MFLLLRSRWLRLFAIGMLLGVFVPGCIPIASLPRDSGAVEAAQETYEGVPVGFTEEGYPYRGDPAAPIVLEEYSDFLCPFCGRHFQQTLPALTEQYGKSGQVQYVFRDMPLVSLHPTAPYGHEAARCVAEQGAALFWAMHDELFRTQQEWAGLADPSTWLEERAQEIGADMDAYRACLASGRQAEALAASIDAGEALGFNGTPSFRFQPRGTGGTYTLVGAYPVETFNEWLGALLAGEAPPQDEGAEAEPPELPFWANQGLAPDPDRPGFTLAGDAYRGDLQAPLVIVEFTDFQCPACREHHLATQPQLDEQLVETGQVLWVVKHFPLRIHERAALAAVAAECAADQGQFWPMYDLLFVTVEQWTQGDIDEAFLALADELALDREAFALCFNRRQALERVLADLYDAQGIIDSTPTFVAISGGRGTLIRGSLGDQFAGALQSLIEDAQAEN